MKSSTLKKVLNYVKKHGAALVLTILLAAVTVGLSLYIPILVGRAIRGEYCGKNGAYR